MCEIQGFLNRSCLCKHFLAMPAGNTASTGKRHLQTNEQRDTSKFSSRREISILIFCAGFCSAARARRCCVIMTLIINNKSDAEMPWSWGCLHPWNVAGAQDGSCSCGIYLPENILQMGIGDSQLKSRNKRGGW